MSNAKEIQKLILGISSIVGILEQKTAGDPYFGAVVDRFNTDIIFAGTGVQAMYRADADTEEFEALVMDNGTDTKEFPAVAVDDAERQAAYLRSVEERKAHGPYGYWDVGIHI